MRKEKIVVKATIYIMSKEIVKFEDLNISDNVKRALKEIRYNEMTEIQ